MLCRCCLRASKRIGVGTFSTRAIDGDATPYSAKSEKKKDNAPQQNGETSTLQAKQGALARRLEEATEHVLLTEGSSGRQAVQDAGFSEEIKEKLLNRFSAADLGKEGPEVLQEVGSTTSADAASRQAWKGGEGAKDAVLRMIDDARRPSSPAAQTKWKTQSPGQRIASARDQVSMYAGAGLKGLSKEEKLEMKQQLKERYHPVARSMPVPVSESGLAAMANRRIDEAIARGQFQKLPRGKRLENDARKNSPYIDTTQFLMNRIIQRQDIVPPWIEKQQELLKSTRVFRSRLRSDWRRHMARMVAAEGGSLQEQIKRAKDYAVAERRYNSHRQSKVVSSDATMGNEATSTLLETQTVQNKDDESHVHLEAGDEEQTPCLFRDAAWIEAERAYLQVSIDNLNSMTRSYNLMAPDVAKKGYVDLQRELSACWADVAPTIADEIQQRATGRASPPPRMPLTGASVMAMLKHSSDAVKIHVEAEEKAYGLRQWWRDLWQKR
ncbi:hypothetical protein CDD82_1598 [Ophiocordyceps australis]|uniref:DnaJ homologue subfamily C member 28 conserved domain-containing protein n=1 Tax=Ophiocordyceps australis TaxID=1399860 RepID=A0A2C5Y664_9HYPO|nr:hypothetical protein CDD82_1598 [Ophiocordyceps australis]